MNITKTPSWDEIKKWKMGDGCDYEYSFLCEDKIRRYPQFGSNHLYYLLDTYLIHVERFLGKGQDPDDVSIKRYDLGKYSTAIKIHTGTCSDPYLLGIGKKRTEYITCFEFFFEKDGELPFCKEIQNDDDEDSYIYVNGTQRDDDNSFEIYVGPSEYGNNLEDACRFVNRVTDRIEKLHQKSIAEKELSHLKGELIYYGWVDEE